MNHIASMLMVVGFVVWCLIVIPICLLYNLNEQRRRINLRKKSYVHHVNLNKVLENEKIL